MSYKISITSFNKNSGATFLGANLASNLSDNGIKTLFVSFDNSFLTSKLLKELVALKSKTLSKNIKGYKKNRYLEILICKEKNILDLKDYLKQNQKSYEFIIFNEKNTAFFDLDYDKIIYIFNANEFNNKDFMLDLQKTSKHHNLKKLFWVYLNMYDANNKKHVQNLILLKQTFRNDVKINSFENDSKVEKQNYFDYLLRNPWSKNTIIINDLIKKLKSFSKETKK